MKSRIERSVRSSWEAPQKAGWDGYTSRAKQESYGGVTQGHLQRVTHHVEVLTGLLRVFGEVAWGFLKKQGVTPGYLAGVSLRGTAKFRCIAQAM